MMERFFLNLKMERVWQRQYANHDEARRDINQYIVGFYNVIRLHSTLGYLSPAAYEVSRIGVKAPGMIAVMAPVRSGVKRRFERPQECGFLLDFATAFSPFSGIGLGLRKLSPSMTMR